MSEKPKQFTFYCTCGASWRGSPAKRFDGIGDVWKEIHSGPGHRPCNAKTAACARQIAELEAEVEMRR